MLFVRGTDAKLGELLHRGYTITLSRTTENRRAENSPGGHSVRKLARSGIDIGVVAPLRSAW